MTNSALALVVVLAGVPQSLFGFDAHQLVGQPVSQCVDIFSEWKQGHGEELSLLEMLVTQVMATSSQSKTGSGCSAWRVGVHRPVAEEHHEDAVSGILWSDPSVHILRMHNISSLVMCRVRFCPHGLQEAAMRPAIPS